MTSGAARFLANRQIQGVTRSAQNRLKRRHRRFTRAMAVLVLPVVVLIRILRPVVLIRFGYILKHKIGHCPAEAEAYLLERAAGKQPNRAIDLFHFDYGTDGIAANLFAEFLARRKIPVFGWVEWLAVANEWLPGAARHRIEIELRDRQHFADTEGLLKQFPQQIDLTPEEEALGRAELVKWGVPADGRFICFHVREASYWKLRKESVGDDSNFRNAHIENCFEAMLAAADRGYYVFRLGALAQEAMPQLHPRIIDYAFHHRSEFMDIFLAARCDLMVSTASGIDTISYFFRRPILYVNLVTWGCEYVKLPQPSLWVFKKFLRNGRLMTFSEVTEMKAQEFTVTADFVKAGITLQENSPDEIKAAVTEMLDRLEQKSSIDDADLARQAKMRAHIRKSSRNRDWQFEVSPSYLRKYESLL